MVLLQSDHMQVLISLNIITSYQLIRAQNYTTNATLHSAIHNQFILAEHEACYYVIIIIFFVLSAYSSSHNLLSWLNCFQLVDS